MMRRIGLLAGTICVLLGTGCEWGGSGDEDFWDDSYSWVNFSGTYRLQNVVAATAGTPGSNTTATTEIQVSNENQGSTGAGLTDSFAGVLDNSPIVAGSVTIIIAGVAFVDNGAEVLVGGNGGTIKYGTGAWTAKTVGNPDAGQPITASYRYQKSGTIINPGTPGQAGSTITYLNVNQKGNLLTMTDNRGVVYNGRVTGASVPENGAEPANNVRMVFEVSNDSAKIVGTLSGDWSGTGTAATGTLSNRELQGTYSSGGKHTDLLAVSGSVSLTPMAITSP